MTLLPEQRDLALVVALTAIMWLPYTIALIARAGFMGAMGNRSSVPALPAWAERAKRAHANAVENLILFAPAVILAGNVRPGSPAVGLAAEIYLLSRIVHWIVYVAGVPVVRTLAFAVGWVATIAILVEALK